MIIFLLIGLIMVVHSQNSCLAYNDKKCIKCSDGYALVSSSCWSCSSNCLKCMSTGYSTHCTQCQLGYYLTNYGCYKCGTNCLQCIPRYSYSSDCIRCQDSYELKQDKDGKYECNYVLGTWKLAGIIGLPFVFLGIVLFCIIRYMVRQNEKQQLNSYFTFQVDPTQVILDQKNRLTYKLFYKKIEKYKDIKHKIKIQLLEQSEASNTYTVEIKNGNYSRFEKRTQHRSKNRVLITEESQLPGHQIKDYYQNVIQFIPKYTYYNDSRISVIYLLRATIKREDWQPQQVSIRQSRRIYSNLDTSKCHFQSNSLQIDKKQICGEIKLIKEKYNIQSFEQYRKYYGRVSLRLENKLGREIAVFYQQDKQFFSYFGWNFPNKFAISQSKIEKKVYIKKGQSVIINEALTLNFGNCLVYSDKAFVSSTPLMIKIRVRSTGILSWLFSFFISKKYEYPILVEQREKLL